MLTPTVIVSTFIQVREEDRLESGPLNRSISVELNVQLVRMRGDRGWEGVATKSSNFLLVMLGTAVHVDEVVVAGFLS